jgi:UrcA family protein
MRYKQFEMSAVWPAALYGSRHAHLEQKETVMGHRQRIASLGSALLAVIAVCAVPHVARGAAPAAQQGQVIWYGDLDLNTRDGVEALYQRIDRAARIACGPPIMTGSRIPTFSWQACVADAIKAAVVKLDRPALTGYYVERMAHVPDRTLAARDR